MTPIFGQTRTHVGAKHALFAPDGHVVSRLPGWEGPVVAHITPELGVGAFTQFTATLEPGQRGKLAGAGLEHFVYVLSGQITIGPAALGPGMFHYAGPGADELVAATAAAKLAVFQKRFAPLEGFPPPASLSGDAAKIAGQPFLGNPKALLQVLLPDDAAYDMAVNIFTYQPGATLPFVETHIMEHGLLMLAGQGVYRLEDRWYPVGAGDVIWMAPYCPQWFVAMGDEPASYLYYKDVNRPFLA